MNGGPPDARHAAPLKTGSLSVQSREKKKVWKVKEKPNTKKQLLTIGDAVKEKTAAKTSVGIPGWKKEEEKEARIRWSLG